MNKTAFNRAVRNGEKAMAEKKIQEPDWEWVRIKHNRKMYLKSLGAMARALDSLYTNIHGESPWGSK